MGPIKALLRPSLYEPARPPIDRWQIRPLRLFPTVDGPVRLRRNTAESNMAVYQ